MPPSQADMVRAQLSMFTNPVSGPEFIGALRRKLATDPVEQEKVCLTIPRTGASVPFTIQLLT